MRGEPKWLSADDLIEINQRLVPTNHVVLSMDMLEAAVAAPKHVFFIGPEDADLVTFAVRLLESVALGHPFLDGNKRVAFYAAANFLQSNGCIFAPPDTEEVAEWVVRLIERKISPSELETLLRPHVVMPHEEQAPKPE